MTSGSAVWLAVLRQPILQNIRDGLKNIHDNFKISTTVSQEIHDSSRKKG